MFANSWSTKNDVNSWIENVYDCNLTLGNVIGPKFYKENYRFSTQFLTVIHFNLKAPSFFMVHRYFN